MLMSCAESDRKRIMNDLFEAGKITFRSGIHSVSYILSDEKMFSVSGLKMLNGQDDLSLPKCMKVMYNGRIKLTYASKGERTFKSLCGFLNFGTFVSLVDKVFRTILNVKNNGFLYAGNLDLDPDRIYVDTESFDIRIHYLPLIFGISEESSAERKLRDDIKAILSEEPVLKCTSAEELCGILDDESMSLEDVYSCFSSAEHAEPAVSFSEQIYDQEQFTRQLDMKLVLRSEDPAWPMEFNINKTSFILGKSQNTADGVIPRSTVSRQHCRILFEDGNYYLEDLDSTNGTKLNGVRLTCYQKNPVRPGDIIKISNISFRLEREGL